MLPDWIDVSLINRGAWIALGVVVLLMYVSMRIVVSTLRKMVALVILLALGVGIWLYRDDLDNCRQTCSCSVAGFDVDFPDAAERQCLAFIESQNE